MEHVIPVMKQHVDKSSVRHFLYVKTGHFFNDLKGVENFGVIHRLLEELQTAGALLILQVDEHKPLIAFRYTSAEAYDEYHDDLLRVGSLLEHGVGTPLLETAQGPRRTLRVRPARFKLPEYDN
jgi:hypothetical protein